MLSNQESNITYVKPFGGYFTVLSDSNDPEAKNRLTESGRRIYFKEYTSLKGFIERVDYSKNEHEGKVYRNLNIYVRSPAGLYCLQLYVFSRPARCFFNIMENIDPGKEVTFTIKRQAGEKKDTLFVSQDGETLRWKYTSEHPGDRPNAEKVNIAGKEVWDYTHQLSWFITKRLPIFQQRLLENAARDEICEEADDLIPDNESDLPF